MPQSWGVASAIRHRAAEVRLMGTYTGAFELVVWSEMARARVMLLINTTLIDVRDVYAGGLPPLPVDAIEHVVVGCKIGKFGKLLAAECVDSAAYVVDFGHYVIGKRVREEVSASSAEAGVDSVHVSPRG